MKPKFIVSGSIGVTDEPCSKGLAFVIVIRDIPPVDNVEVGGQGLRECISCHKARVGKWDRIVKEE